jgi:putative addiction module killer protein
VQGKNAVVFKQTGIFGAWLRGLDASIRLLVVHRIDRAKNGNFGEHKLLKDTGGIWEMIIDVGPGYRLYYCQEAGATYWLLAGGAKKTQVRDVGRAMAIRDELRRNGYGKAHQV